MPIQNHLPPIPKNVAHLDKAPAQAAQAGPATAYRAARQADVANVAVKAPILDGVDAALPIHLRAGSAANLIAAGNHAPASAPTAYAKIAQMGNHAGYVTTKSGQEIYVSIRLGKNPEKTPTVFVGGLTHCHDFSKDFEKNVSERYGHTMVTVLLPGQGETLKQTAQKGICANQCDFSPEAQVKVLRETLEALEINGKVHIAGLSYGGAIAGAFQKMHPELVDKTLLISPYIINAMRADPMRGTIHAMMNNPWNPFGKIMYDSAMKMGLMMGSEMMSMMSTMLGLGGRSPIPGMGYVGRPDVLSDHITHFHDAVYGLTMGLDPFDLSHAIENSKNVHMLHVPGDMLSPPDQNMRAFGRVKHGSFKTANPLNAGNWGCHDLVVHQPRETARWVNDVLTGAVREVQR